MTTLRVLGTTQVLGDDGVPVEIAGRKRRSVLAGLALHLESGISQDALVDLVWGDDAGGTVGSLHSYISGLRRALEPGLGPRERPSTLLTVGQGYRLAVAPEQVDAHEFAATVRRSHRMLAPLASQLTSGDRAGWPSRSDTAAAVEALEVALSLWAGQPYADLPDHPDVVAERAALEELRLSAEEDRVLGLLALGDHATVVAVTEQATARHPLRERLWALHALALTRAGRQGDALAALRQARAHLADELGLDPGQELRDLEQAILQQAATLHVWLAEAASPTAAPHGPTRARVPWETVGRSHEEQALTALLGEAGDGRLALGSLVGEAGIGKSRLVEQLVAEARAEGFAVGVGRCSQDDGAPPLWPWRAVTRAIAAQLGEDEPTISLDAGDADPERAAFEAWESLASLLRRWAGTQPVLVVLEDLHWADRATLRALAHLVSTQGDDLRLAVLTTRRPFPPPEGTAGDVEELWTRRHAVRLDVEGLTRAQSRALVDVVAERPVPDGVLDDWHERSGGNPFFLVELARSGPESGLPATLRDLILRRVARLPDEVVELVRQAAVVGSDFRVEVVASAAGVGVDETDTLLDHARSLGLVRDREPGQMSFDHALTRDAVLDAVSPTRRARLHARVAHALETDPEVARVVPTTERTSELASHWLAAGPSHTSRAWRAALAAAALAREAFSHEEAAGLVAAAVDAHRRDPEGSRAERYDLLMTLARDAQRMAAWTVVVDSATEAVALALADHDLDRVGRAAASLSHLALWTVHQFGEVDHDLVEDLRQALRLTGDEESATRCRLLGALALELYYEPGSVEQRDELAAESVATARRLADPALLWWATRAAYIATWRPATAADRLLLARTSLEAAEEWGDDDARTLALAALAGTELELADLEGYLQHSEAAMRLARRRRLSYVPVALGFVDLCHAAMAGDAAAVERHNEELRELRTWVEIPGQQAHEVATMLLEGFWSLQPPEPFVQAMVDLAQTPDGALVVEAALVLLARLGRVEEARRVVKETGWQGPLPEIWSSSQDWAFLAEIAAVLGDEQWAQAAREQLAPLRGRLAVAGISSQLGPVDGYLALAEAMLGDHARAAELADAASAYAERAGWVRYVAWLDRWRVALDF